MKVLHRSDPKLEEDNPQTQINKGCFTQKQPFFLHPETLSRPETYY